MRLGTLVVLSYLLCACASLPPEPEVVYHDPQVNSETQTVILLPVTNWQGESVDVELTNDLNSKWEELYGQGKAVPIRMSLEEVDPKMSAFYKRLIATLQNGDHRGKIHKSKSLRYFVTKVKETLGPQNWAITIIQGGKEAYEKGEPFSVSIAVFDTNEYKWKWLTTAKGQKGQMGDWTGWKKVSVKNLFEQASIVMDSKESMAAPIASSPVE